MIILKNMLRFMVIVKDRDRVRNTVRNSVIIRLG